MTIEQRRQVLLLVNEVDSILENLDDIILSMAVIRDKWVYMTREWLLKNGELTLIQTYKEQVLINGEKLRKLI